MRSRDHYATVMERTPWGNGHCGTISPGTAASVAPPGEFSVVLEEYET